MSAHRESDFPAARGRALSPPKVDATSRAKVTRVVCDRRRDSASRRDCCDLAGVMCALANFKYAVRERTSLSFARRDDRTIDSRKPLKAHVVSQSDTCQ